MPLPYTDEEFKIDLTWKDTDIKLEPPPYVHIRRSILYMLFVTSDQLLEVVKVFDINLCMELFMEKC